MSCKYGYTNGDYYIGEIKTEETHYEIGTNNDVLFLSEETLILPTVDCLIRINDDDFWQVIHGDDYFVSHRRILKIHFKKLHEEGTIEIWSEGDITQ